MSAVGRGRALRAAGLAGLIALAPAVAACGGSDGGAAGGVSASVGPSGASVSVSGSASVPSTVPSVSSSGGALQAGQTVTLTGTVTQTYGAGHVFLLRTTTQPQPVPVASVSVVNVAKGDMVTVTGQVAKVNLALLEAQFTFTPPPAMSKYDGALVVNAQSVTPAASVSATPSGSASS